MYFGKSVELMFVEVSVAFVEPRGQYYNFYICPHGATWTACTVVYETCLEIYWRVNFVL